ncbi:hypothetical protein A3A66_02195 [Microgenomates group bacterium RIFCSPLOWO2_01_FULL_46_13]|nr:MAG: hypothetical protein A2783_01965 [Microgenomates group bacterium RIFCSPHIGHO2_01_FULL_45_11]OGV94787.1 MAG: hypothetical protein A3A66_02195 [Microgenomates group bacterium RIFCSPLOWO2_01_FULL_46_13]
MPQDSFSVNLLSRRQASLTRQRESHRKIIMISTVIILTYLGILIPLVAFRVFVSIQLASLNQKINKEKQVLQSLSATEVKYLLVHTKLKLANQIISSRADVPTILAAAFDTMPEGVTLQNLTFKDENSVNLSAIATDVFRFYNLVEALKTSPLKALFKTIAIESTSRNETAEYLARITLSKEEIAFPQPNPTPSPATTVSDEKEGN